MSSPPQYDDVKTSESVYVNSMLHDVDVNKVTPPGQRFTSYKYCNYMIVLMSRPVDYVYISVFLIHIVIAMIILAYTSPQQDYVFRNDLYAMIVDEARNMIEHHRFYQIISGILAFVFVPITYSVLFIVYHACGTNRTLLDTACVMMIRSPLTVCILCIIP